MASSPAFATTEEFDLECGEPRIKEQSSLSEMPNQELAVTTSSQLSQMPLLQEAQELLKQQLIDMQSSCEAELRERHKEVKDAKRKREDLGVELFGFQQQLRGIFQSLDEGAERDSQLKTLNGLVKRNLEEKMRHVAHAQSAIADSGVQVEEERNDLERVAAALRQTEDFFTAKKGEVAVTKRETYAADEALQRREKDKQEQDRLVLHLEREIEIQRSRLADGVSICEAEQLKRQKLDVDIREVELTIQGASQQGQAKLLKWRESIAELNKKDKQLQGLHKGTAKLEEEIRCSEMEAGTVKASLSQLGRSNLKLLELLHRLQGATAQTSAKIGTAVSQQKDLEAQKTALDSTISSSREGIAEAKAENRALRDASRQLEREVELSCSRVKGGKDKSLRQLEEATFAERGSHKLVRELKALEEEAITEETTNAGLLKEINALKARCDSQQIGISRDTETAEALDRELNILSTAISDKEVAYRKRRDLVEQRLRDIAAGNRKIESITSQKGAETKSDPLETGVNNLRDKLDKARGNCQSLQRQWITCQRELITVQASNSSNAEALLKAETKAAIYVQRERRLLQLQRSTEAELRQVKKRQDQQQAALHACDAELALQKSQEVQLLEEQTAVDEDSRLKLNEAEVAGKALEDHLHSARQQRACSQIQLQAAQSKVCGLEEKICQGIELHARLAGERPDQNPKVAVQKSLQKLASEHADLGMAQAKLLDEIKLAIQKREGLFLRGQADALKLQPSAVQASETAGRHRIAAELQKAHKKIMAESAKARRGIAELKLLQEVTSKEEEIAVREHAELSATIAALQQDVDNLSQQRVQDVFKVSLLQKKGKLLEELAKKDGKQFSREGIASDKLDSARTQSRKLLAAVAETHSLEKDPLLQKLCSEITALQILGQ